MVRFWCRTISPAPSTASGTMAGNRWPAAAPRRGGGRPLPLAVPPGWGAAATWGGAAVGAAGRRKALQCQACHGLDGLSKLPEAPHLAGQPERYLVKSLDDYRKGVRSHDMMTLVAKALSDQDIADLAAYYAAIEVSVMPPK